MCINSATIVLAVTLATGGHGTEAIMRCYDKPSFYFAMSRLNRQQILIARSAEKHRIAKMKIEGKG